MTQQSFAQKLENTCKNLANHGFTTAVYTGREAVTAALLQEIPSGATVGIGGSVTARELGLADALRANGCNVFWHWEMEDAATAWDQAFHADFYLCSANAVDESGVLYNIDGTGNRVGATVYGPTKVRMIVGRNKIVSGGEAAIDRVKNVACPQNAVRLGLKTPCAITGRCSDCSSPQRMCGATVILERRPKCKDFSVLLVDEDLGY